MRPPQSGRWLDAVCVSFATGIYLKERPRERVSLPATTFLDQAFKHREDMTEGHGFAGCTYKDYDHDQSRIKLEYVQSAH